MNSTTGTTPIPAVQVGTDVQAGTSPDPRDCGTNRIATGHVFRLDWHGGYRCWCHNWPLAQLTR